MKNICIGILAHVDAGKTTLSEALLYRAGAIRRLGRVDHQDAFLDTDAMERQRGITIFSKQAVLELSSVRVTLLDTPGHVDFSAEMERTLQVLDCAVLVISGTDGVQGHTRTLWELLERYHVPTFLFINKMDLAGTDRDALLAHLKEKLDGGCVDFGDSETLAEEAAVLDEAVLERYLETGEVSNAALSALIAERKLFPCYFGSALRVEGVDALLSGVERYAPRPVYPADFGAKVFKITRDAQGARLTHLKLTGGTLRVKDVLTGREGDTLWQEKADQLRLYSGAKFQSLDEAEAGAVVAVTGLSHTFPGQGLGAEPDWAGAVLQPVLTYRVELSDGTDPHTALQKLRQLEEEDPQLHLVWSGGDIHIQLMGEVQMEILQRLIRERLGMEVSFGAGTVCYRETIANAVEGIGHFEPLRHYAEVHLLLEPGEPGSGVIAAIGYDPERDTENPADSVFCSHGAGVIVPWFEVCDHAQVESGWQPKSAAPEPETSGPKQRTVSAYAGTIEQDRELQAIFERTYGTVKRWEFIPPKAPRRPIADTSEEKRRELKRAFSGEEYLLVDGYNIIFAWDELKKIAAENLDAARKQLCELLCNYQGYRKCRVILVFDAYKVKGGLGSVEKYHNITIVYTREAETADAYIERATYEIGRQHRVRVATSDGPEQVIILGHGALRLSASAFHEEMAEVQKQIGDTVFRNNQSGARTGALRAALEKAKEGKK